MAKGMLEEMDPVYRKKQTSRFTQLGISSFNPRSLLERIQQRNTLISGWNGCRIRACSLRLTRMAAL